VTICAQQAAGDPRFQPSLHFTLTNRRPARWRNKQQVDIGGNVGVALLADLPADEFARAARSAGLSDEQAEAVRTEVKSG